MKLTRRPQKAEWTETTDRDTRHQTANASGHRRAPTVARADAEGAAQSHPRGLTRGTCRLRLSPASQTGSQPDVAPRPPRPTARCQALPTRPTRPKTKDSDGPRHQTAKASDHPRAPTAPRAQAEGATPRRRHPLSPTSASSTRGPYPEPPRACHRAPRTIGISLGVHAPRGRSEVVTQPRVVPAHALVQRLDRPARRLARRRFEPGPVG